MKKLKLSAAYKNTQMYAMIYSIYHGSKQVEFVDEKFFSSKRECVSWFNENFNKKHFIEPRCVRVVSFNKLKLVTDD